MIDRAAPDCHDRLDPRRSRSPRPSRCCCSACSGSSGWRRPAAAPWRSRRCRCSLPLRRAGPVRLYTYRWMSLLVWLYVAEGAVRATSERGTRRLAGRRSRWLLATRSSSPARHAHVRGRAAARHAGGERAEPMSDAARAPARRRRRGQRARRRRPRGLGGRLAQALARQGAGRRRGPARTAEVAQVVRAVRRARHDDRAAGRQHRPRRRLGARRQRPQLVLSLARLDRVRGIDAANMTMTVEAGCVLQRAQQAAADAGLLLALSLGAEGSCTIGGNLATNAGGTQVLRYGNAREQCLGLEVVTAAGEVWDGLTGLRKDNTGYDLRDLMIGSEGTLGIITAATMKLQPRPAAVLTALATPADARCGDPAARARPLDARPGPDRLRGDERVLARPGAQALPGAAPAAAAGAVDGAARAVRRRGREPTARRRSRRCSTTALERGLIDDTAIASSIEQANAMWHLRESITLAQAEEGPNIKHDISLPVSAIRDFVASTDAALAARPARHPPGRLRPPRRRQPALQRAVPGRRGCGRVPAPRGRGQQDRLRRGRGAAAARSRPSTASAG